MDAGSIATVVGEGGSLADCESYERGDALDGEKGSSE